MYIAQFDSARPFGQQAHNNFSVAKKNHLFTLTISSRNFYTGWSWKKTISAFAASHARPFQKCRSIIVVKGVFARWICAVDGNTFEAINSRSWKSQIIRVISYTELIISLEVRTNVFGYIWCIYLVHFHGIFIRNQCRQLLIFDYGNLPFQENVDMEILQL